MAGQIAYRLFSELDFADSLTPIIGFSTSGISIKNKINELIENVEFIHQIPTSNSEFNLVDSLIQDIALNQFSVAIIA